MRLFVGLKLPADICHALQGLMRGLKHARWQSSEQMHITLRFIGETDPQAGADIVSALRSIRHPPVTVRIRGVNIFGKPRAPRILWAGVERNQMLEHLHEKINQALRIAGSADEKHRFVPHVTLARFPRHIRIKDIPAYLEGNASFQLPAIELDEFHLYRSHLGHGGAHYEILDTIALSKPTP